MAEQQLPLYDSDDRLIGWYDQDALRDLIRDGLATPVRSGCRQRTLRRVVLRREARAAPRVLAGVQALDGAGTIATRREMAGIPVLMAWRLLVRKRPVKATA